MTNMEQKIVKTGTTTLGMVCKDGLVIAADKRATVGHMIANKNTEKVVLINDRMVVTTAGNASDAQLLCKIFRAQVKLEEMRRGKNLKIKEAASLLGSLVYGNVRRPSMIPGITGFIMGGVDSEGFGLYELFYDGTTTCYPKFICSGSGSAFALSYLDSHYKQTITINEGKNIAIKAVNAAMHRDSASGDGVDVVVITKEGAKKIFTEKVDSRLPSSK